jgi:hypothetical protein
MSNLKEIESKIEPLSLDNLNLKSELKTIANELQDIKPENKKM